MTSLSRSLGVFLAALLPALALHGAGAGAAFADEEPALPPGTAHAMGYPPYRPLGTAEPELAAWCDACLEAGRALRGSRRGGDLLGAAGEVLARRLGRLADADDVFAEAAANYPPDDPSIGVLLITWAGHASRRGHTARVGRLLDQIRPWADATRPADLDAPDVYRWDLLQGAVAWDLPAVEALWLERNGRFLPAAERLVDLARTALPGREPGAVALLWERVARLRYRGGARAEALAAIDEALALREDDDTAVATLGFWRLQAAHGLLDEMAAPSMTAHWPGEDYERDVAAYLRAIQGTPGITTRYLTLASGALAGGRLAAALAIYELALRDPTVAEAARHDALVWRGLLPAWQAALALGRLDEAERLLEAIERIADEPIPEKDAYLVAIRRRRAEDGPSPVPAAPPPVPPQAAPPLPEPTGPASPLGIETGERTAAQSPPPAADAAPQPFPGRWPTWLWVGALAALGLLLAWRLRR